MSRDRSATDTGDGASLALYAWKAPRDLTAEEAATLVATWLEAGGDPAASPFEPSTDVGWFYRELVQDLPGLDVTSDAVPRTGHGPIWLATDPEAPARIVAMRLTPATAREELDEIYSLAMKYDLVLLDPRGPRLRTPLSEMATYASATFWPRGAIRAAVAGGLGGLAAVAAWLLSIPILSGVVMLGGGFMFVMAVWTFIHEGRKRLG